MPTFVNSYGVDSGAPENTDALITPAFTPVNGEVLVVKMATWDTASTMNAPTGGSQTYTERVRYNPGSVRCWVGIYTAVISGSPSNMTVTAGHTGPASMHSMVVERWSSAALAATPVTQTANANTDTPSASLTTSASNSVISAVCGDWNGNSPATRIYLGTSTEEFVYDGPDEPGWTCHYYWRQSVASAGATTFGMSAPTGQVWTLAGIEILHSAGGQSVTLGSVSDVSSALAASKRKTRTVLVLSDTSSAAALAGAKRRALGAVADAESLSAIGRMKVRTVGVVSASETLSPVGRAKVRGLNSLSEGSTATAVGETKSRMLALTVDSETVLTLARIKVTSLAVVSEVESASGLARAKVRTLGLVSESDIPWMFGSGLSVVLGTVTESSSALALSQHKAGILGLASESSASLAITKTKSRNLGIMEDSSSVIGIARSKRFGISSVAEIGTALPISGSRLTLGLVSEIGIALSLVMANAGNVGQGITDVAGLRMSRMSTYRR